jgi:hypothetical protein
METLDCTTAKSPQIGAFYILLQLLHFVTETGTELARAIDRPGSIGELPIKCSSSPIDLPIGIRK